MSNLNSIRHMLPDYRPDEKFLKYGAEALTGAELLAIVLRSGNQSQSSVELTAQILKNERSGHEDLLNIFYLEYDDLIRINGIGKVKALQIKAVAELSKRISMSQKAELLEFNDAQTIAGYYMEQLRHRKREVVLLILLDSGCRLLKDLVISEGTINASLFSPREIFIEAFKYEAVNIILLHNHPSGKPSPSNADIAGTKNICLAGRLLGINLLDHIIIGDQRYFSFKEKGLLDE